MKSSKSTTLALAKLRAHYPFPEVGDVKGEYYALDGGGRELVKELIRDNGVRTMVEIGCFLGGSAVQWLRSSETLTVVGIDPWEGKWYETLRKYQSSPVMSRTFSEIEDPDAFIDSIERNGNFIQTMANLAEFRDRFIPVRGYSPEILDQLAKQGLEPDLVYVDSVKHREDLDAIQVIWPDTILCGDDWSWGPDLGYPMQRAVKGFAEEHQFKITAVGATWVIDKSQDSLAI